jgi:hypothetical protein
LAASRAQNFRWGVFILPPPDLEIRRRRPVFAGRLRFFTQGLRQRLHPQRNSKPRNSNVKNYSSAPSSLNRHGLDFLRNVALNLTEKFQEFLWTLEVLSCT